MALLLSTRLVCRGPALLLTTSLRHGWASLMSPPSYSMTTSLTRLTMPRSPCPCIFDPLALSHPPPLDAPMFGGSVVLMRSGVPTLAAPLFRRRSPPPYPPAARRRRPLPSSLSFFRLVRTWVSSVSLAATTPIRGRSGEHPGGTTPAGWLSGLTG